MAKGDIHGVLKVIVKQVDWLELPETITATGKNVFANQQFIANYSKLRLWEFTEYSKLIYLDSDVLPLQNIDDMMLAPAFSAVLDNMTPDHGFSHARFQVPSFTPKASLHCGKAYFNAGVFVFEPSKAHLDTMLSSLADYPPSRFAEQDFLNDFFKGQWNMLPLSFNWGKPNFWLCPQLCPSSALKIVHFSGKCKPWHRQPNGGWTAESVARALPEERDLMLQPESRLSMAIDEWWNCYTYVDQSFKLLTARQEQEMMQATVAAQSLRLTDKRRVCIATFLSGNGDYYKGVLGLKRSLDRCSTKLPLVVAITTDVPQSQRKIIQAAGCTLREVEVDVPKSLQGKPKLDLYMLCYAKLQLWLWDEFSTIVYLDADTAVTSSIDALTSLRLPMDHVAGSLDWGFATQGTGSRRGAPYFNAGVMVFTPSSSTHQRMMAALAADGTIGEYAEQDMLNDFFRERLIVLPETYNFIQDYYVPTSLPAPVRQQELVSSLQGQLPKVVHYAGAKPWRGSLSGQLLDHLKGIARTEEDTNTVAEVTKHLDLVEAEWHKYFNSCHDALSAVSAATNLGLNSAMTSSTTKLLAETPSSSQTPAAPVGEPAPPAGCAVMF
eukprot:scaffold5393_cov35-Prasinocladus_malaysianus.AAC.3